MEEQTGRQLNTWTEIARHMCLSVRAVQNYERTVGLPIRRMPGPRGRVWAYAAELDSWKRDQSAKVPSRHVGYESTGTSKEVPDGDDTGLVVPPSGGIVVAPAFERNTGFVSHHIHAGLAALLYSLLCGESVILEVAYRLDKYIAAALTVSLLACAWSFLSILGALWINCQLNIRLRPKLALPVCLCTMLLALAMLYIGVSRFLPNITITQASFETMPAPAAYLKDVVVYFLPLALVFIVLPFHVILVLDNRGLAEPRSAGDSITDLRLSGGLFIQPRVLWVLLVIAFLLSLILSSRLFEALQPSPYRNAFLELAYVRGLLFFALAIECTFWYHMTVNGLVPRLDGAR